MRQHFSCYTKIVSHVAFSVGATGIRGKQEGAGRQQMQVQAQEPSSRVALHRLGCSLLPNPTHRACSLSVQRQGMCSACARMALFSQIPHTEPVPWLSRGRGCALQVLGVLYSLVAGEQQSSCQGITPREGPQTSNSQQDFALSCPTHQIQQEHFSPDTDSSLLGKETLWALQKKNK